VKKAKYFHKSCFNRNLQENYLEFNDSSCILQQKLCVLFSCGSTAQFWGLAASMKLSVSFQLLDLGQSAGLFFLTGDQLVARPLLTVPGDCDDVGELGGMNGFGRGNRSTRRKPAPTPLCPPQIPLARHGRDPRPPQWEASG
jgi:hypothetical protein